MTIGQVMAGWLKFCRVPGCNGRTIRCTVTGGSQAFVRDSPLSGWLRQTPLASKLSSVSPSESFLSVYREMKGEKQLVVRKHVLTTLKTHVCTVERFPVKRPSLNSETSIHNTTICDPTNGPW